MNNYWKAACIVALVLAGFLGGWYVNGKRHAQEIASLKQQYAEEKAEAEKQAKELADKQQTQMQEQAELYQKAVASSNSDIEKLKKELKNASKKNPLPDSCNLGTDRMSIIKQAVSRANSSKAR